MLTLLHEKYPDKHYTGIDLTPKMIEVAKAKKMQGVELIVGDCENLPFAENSFVRVSIIIRMYRISSTVCIGCFVRMVG